MTGKKIEFDLEEFVPLLLSNKQEGFRLIGERFLNAVMEKEFEAFIGAGKHERSKKRIDKSLASIIVEGYLKGISTRKVEGGFE